MDAATPVGHPIRHKYHKPAHTNEPHGTPVPLTHYHRRCPLCLAISTPHTLSTPTPGLDSLTPHLLTFTTFTKAHPSPRYLFLPEFQRDYGSPVKLPPSNYLSSTHHLFPLPPRPTYPVERADVHRSPRHPQFQALRALLLESPHPGRRLASGDVVHWTSRSLQRARCSSVRRQRKLGFTLKTG